MTKDGVIVTMAATVLVVDDNERIENRLHELNAMAADVHTLGADVYELLHVRGPCLFVSPSYIQAWHMSCRRCYPRCVCIAQTGTNCPKSAAPGSSP